MLKCLVIVLCAITIVFCAPGYENLREKPSARQRHVTDQLSGASRTKRQNLDTVEIVYVDAASIDPIKLKDLQRKESFPQAPVNVFTNSRENIQQLSGNNLEVVSQNSNYVVYKLKSSDDLPLNGLHDDKKAQGSQNQFYDYDSEQYSGYSGIKNPSPPPPPDARNPPPPPPDDRKPPPPPPHHHHSPPPPPPDDYDRSSNYDRYNYYNRPPSPPHSRSPYDDRSTQYYDDRQTRQSSYDRPPPPHRGGPPHDRGPPPSHGGRPPRYDEPSEYHRGPPPHYGGPPPHHGPPDRYDRGPRPPRDGPPDRYDDRPPPRHGGPPHRFDDRPPPHHGGPPHRFDDRPPPPRDRYDNRPPPPPDRYDDRPHRRPPAPPNDRRPPAPPNDRRPPPDQDPYYDQGNENNEHSQDADHSTDVTLTSSTTEAATDDDQYQLDVRFNDEETESMPVETMKRDVPVLPTAAPLSPYIFQAVAVTPVD